MPWVKRRGGGCPSSKPWGVFNKNTGRRVGCHATEEGANAQVRALYAAEATSISADEYRAMEGLPGGETAEGHVLLHEVSTVETEVAETEAELQRWRGVLAFENVPTDDGRIFLDFGWRDLPLDLMAQFANDEGHSGAVHVGRIDRIWKEPAPEHGENAQFIMGEGVFSNEEDGLRAARLVGDEMMRQVSVDPFVTEAALMDPESHELIDPEDVELSELLFDPGKYLRAALKSTIAAATLVTFPAFSGTQLMLVAAGGRLVMTGPAISLIVDVDEQNAESMARLEAVGIDPVVLTAAAAGLAPLKPPVEWFDWPESSHPTPLTVTPEGQVYGHLAVWGQCHIAWSDVCRTPPRSPSGYQFFHLGEIETAEGHQVNVGKLTVGEAGHAPTFMSGRAAVDHYDKTGCCAAYVRARDGKIGIWLSGAIRSDLPAEKLRDLRANPPSGDWREERGRLELRAALCVPVPGYPVPRAEAQLVASGDEERVTALVATGYVPEGAVFSREHQRKVAVLSSRARAILKTLPRASRDPIQVSFETQADIVEMGTTDFENLGRFVAQIAEDNRLWRDDPDLARAIAAERLAFFDAGLEPLEFSAEERRKMAKSGVALPDGSFPIPDCSHAEKAIRAQGRAPEAKRPRVRAHIRRRVRSLSCSGGIFDAYK
jgi:hypothetical protein